jgi:hypothetical protein
MFALHSPRPDVSRSSRGASCAVRARPQRVPATLAVSGRVLSGRDRSPRRLVLQRRQVGRLRRPGRPPIAHRRRSAIGRMARKRSCVGAADAGRPPLRGPMAHASLSPSARFAGAALAGAARRLRPDRHCLVGYRGDARRRHVAAWPLLFDRLFSGSLSDPTRPICSTRSSIS